MERLLYLGYKALNDIVTFTDFFVFPVSSLCTNPSFTFLVPFVYIFVGLRSKERAMLDVGLGCLAAAVFSFRYYYHVMPLAWAAVIGGAALFLTAYFSIRYLYQSKGPYAYDEDAETSLLQEIEQQLIEQTIVNQPGPKPDKSAAFGGGGSGGDF